MNEIFEQFIATSDHAKMEGLAHLRDDINWLPLADTLLTQTPKYGSSNMIRMRKLVNDVRFNANSADAEGRCSDDIILLNLIQDFDMVEQTREEV